MLLHSIREGAYMCMSQAHPECRKVGSHAYLNPEETLAFCLLPHSRQELQNSGCILALHHPLVSL